MPELGEIKNGRDIGYKDRGHRMWAACEVCGKQRWVVLKRGKLVSNRCLPCFSKSLKGIPTNKTPTNWKGGRTITNQGYVMVWISSRDFFYPMANKQSYVMEHRLVMAKKLGRNLQPWWCEEHLVATFSAAKVTAEEVKRVAEEYLELRGQKYDERRMDD